MPSRPEAEPVCTHRWQIAPPHGIYSLGICRKCGAERTFTNASEMTTFGYGRSQPRVATR